MEALVRRTRGKLIAIARKIGAPQDAEDSVQAAYHALLRRPAVPVTVEAWLTTAVIRIAYRRKALARNELQLAETLARDGDPQAEAARREESNLLRHEVARLPANYRDALVLRWLEGLSVEETARLLDRPAATVKTHTRRGLTLLRARVAPWAAHAILAGPWLLADSMRSAAGWGILMNTKTTVGMAGIVIAAGAVGVGVGMSTTQEDARIPRREARQEPRADLDRTLGTLRAPDRSPATGYEPVDIDKHEAVQTPVAQPENAFDERLAEAGRRLGASDEALAAVTAAMSAVRQYSKKRSPETAAAQSDALGAIGAYGGEGCRAAIAHLSATRRPRIGYLLIMDATWEPGMERHLLELARDAKATPTQRQFAMRCLSLGDTPDVRDYLLAELEGAKNEKLISGAALSLGWLKEKRAAPILERLLYRSRRRVFQESILNGLRTLGSKEAGRIVAEFVSKDHPVRTLMSGMRALRSCDPAAAKEAAQRILDSAQAKELTPNDRAILEATAR